MAILLRKEIRSAGLVRDLSARRDATTLRLAMIYALLDGTDRIQFDHVLAARGIWGAGEKSLGEIWGTGDNLADKLAAILHRKDDDGNLKYADTGLSLTEQRAVLGHNWESEKLRSAVEVLVGLGVARWEKTPTGGRPAETLFPVIAPSSQGALTQGEGGISGEKGRTPRDARANE